MRSAKSFKCRILVGHRYRRDWPNRSNILRIKHLIWFKEPCGHHRCPPAGKCRLVHPAVTPATKHAYSFDTSSIPVTIRLHMRARPIQATTLQPPVKFGHVFRATYRQRTPASKPTFAKQRAVAQHTPAGVFLRVLLSYLIPLFFGGGEDERHLGTVWSLVRIKPVCDTCSPSARGKKTHRATSHHTSQ